MRRTWGDRGYSPWIRSIPFRQLLSPVRCLSFTKQHQQGHGWCPLVCPDIRRVCCINIKRSRMISSVLFLTSIPLINILQVYDLRLWPPLIIETWTISSTLTGMMRVDDPCEYVVPKCVDTCSDLMFPSCILSWHDTSFTWAARCWSIPECVAYSWITNCHEVWGTLRIVPGIWMPISTANG